VHKYISICSYSHTLKLLYNNVGAQTAFVVFNQSATTLFPDFQKQALHKEDFIKVTNKTTEQQQYLNTLTSIVVLMSFATHMISPSPNRCCYTNPKEVMQKNH
jgi:site-specific recombinase XerD